VCAILRSSDCCVAICVCVRAALFMFYVIQCIRSLPRPTEPLKRVVESPHMTFDEATFFPSSTPTIPARQPPSVLFDEVDILETLTHPPSVPVPIPPAPSTSSSAPSSLAPSATPSTTPSTPSTPGPSHSPGHLLGSPEHFFGDGDPGDR
jgi:hypothetical protein